MNFSAELKNEALEKLQAVPSKESLHALISWLDIKICSGSETYDSLYEQILVRGCIALGYHILTDSGPLPTVVKTVRSAEEYALNPCERTWDSLFHDATQSFPYGPGDGCHSIENNNCAIGNGCKSGSGCLDVGSVPHDIAMRVIASEVIPWINGTDDPVISRDGHV